MKIQDRLIQVRFIDIHQIFGKKIKVGYFWVLYFVVVGLCVFTDVAFCELFVV